MSREKVVATYVGKKAQYQIKQVDTAFSRYFQIYKNGERWEISSKHMDVVVNRILKYDSSAKPI